MYRNPQDLHVNASNYCDCGVPYRNSESGQTEFNRFSYFCGSSRHTLL